MSVCYAEVLSVKDVSTRQRRESLGTAKQMTKFEIELKKSYIVVESATRIIEAKDEDEAREVATSDMGDVEWGNQKTMEYQYEVEGVTEMDE